MKQSYVFSLTIIGVLFMLLGAALGINGLLIPYLKEAFQLSSASSYLIVTATFSAFVLFGYPSGLIISQIGYRKAIVLSFVLFAIGLFLFIPSGKQASFYLFLVASFVLGMANTLLQAAINPYITILGHIDSAAKRMCIMTICNRSGWALSPLFLSLFLDITQTEIRLEDLFTPFYILIAIFVLMGVLTWFVPLPEITAQGEDDNDLSIESLQIKRYVERKKTVFQFPHLILGVFTLFFYVGIDTLCLVSIVDFANTIGLSNPERYTSYSVLGISLGCVLAIFLVPKHLSQIRGLQWGTVLALIVSLFIPVIAPSRAIFLLPVVAFLTCLTWGAVWPLALSNLGKYTKKGSALLVSAIVGGALIPLIFGCMKDWLGIQSAYWLFSPSLLFVLFYACKGYKIGLKIEEE